MDKKIKEQIDRLIKSSKVFMFMKGTPEEPMCGFSAKAVEVLNNGKIKFETFDVYSDEDVRAGIKEYSKWPTIPQIFINGKFIGGSDILVAMAEKGELGKMISLS